MYDVGGQRSERKKWIHVFDNVQVVMFLAAISGYDQSLIEDRKGVSIHPPNAHPMTLCWSNTQNQMNEALFLFEQIANSQYFVKSALILFLNKIDLFKEKVASGMSPIGRHFPDYRGRPTEVEAGMKFFSDKFKKLVKDTKKEIYVHYTNATDTTLLKVTMRAVQDMIVQRNLNNLILWRIDNITAPPTVFLLGVQLTRLPHLLHWRFLTQHRSACCQGYFRSAFWIILQLFSVASSFAANLPKIWDIDKTDLCQDTTWQTRSIRLLWSPVFFLTAVLLFIGAMARCVLAK